MHIFMCVLPPHDRAESQEAESHPEEAERRKKDRKREGKEEAIISREASGQRPQAESQRQTMYSNTAKRHKRGVLRERFVVMY